MPTPRINAEDIIANNILGNKIHNKKVIIDDSSTPFRVKDDKGDIVFWVDNSGCNIKALESKTNFLELLDTPDYLGDENSVLLVKDESLCFSNNLNVDNVKCEKLFSQQVHCDRLNTTNINLDSIVCKSVLTDKINTDDLKANSLLSQNLNCKNIDSESIKCNNFKCDDLSLKKLNLHELNGEKSNLKSIKTIDCKTTNLDCKTAFVDNIKSNEIDITDAKIDNLKLKNLDLKELELEASFIKKLFVNDLNVLSQVTQHYGSLTEPLFLALTQQNTLELLNGKNHIITTKIARGIKKQSFYINNLPKNPRLTCELYNSEIVTTPLICHIGDRTKININLAEKAEDEIILVLYIDA